MTDSEIKCPYFGECGGCSLQHIPYEVQIENKRKVVQQLLDFEDVKIFSDSPYAYRNRMDFIFHKGGIGFRKKGNFKQMVDIKHCAISEPKVNKLLAELREHFKDCDYFNVIKNTGTFKYAVVRIANTSSVSFVLNQDSTRIEEATKHIEAFAKKTSAENILVSYVPKESSLSTSEEFYVVKGNEDLQSTYFSKKLTYSAQGFFQNNHRMAKKMHEYVTSLISKEKYKTYHLLDAYGGVGAFGIINAHLFNMVTTVESYEGCTRSAEKNCVLNNVSNVTAICKDAKQLRNLDLSKPLVIITDPPRSGMHMKTIEWMNESGAEHIGYISCNPKQMAGELKRFKKYSIESVAVFDLFPQTNHMEAVVELKLL